VAHAESVWISKYRSTRTISDGSSNCGLFITIGHAHTRASDRDFQTQASKRWESKSNGTAFRRTAALWRFRSLAVFITNTNWSGLRREPLRPKPSRISFLRTTGEEEAEFFRKLAIRHGHVPVAFLNLTGSP